MYGQPYVLHIEKYSGATAPESRDCNWTRWCKSFILALQRLTQVDLCEFQGSVVYRGRSRQLRLYSERYPPTQDGERASKQAAAAAYNYPKAIHKRLRTWI